MSWRKQNLFVRGMIALGVIGLFFFLFAFTLTLVGSEKEFWSEGEGRIALLSITGPITEAQPVIEQLHRFGKDNSIKAIILRIDSPGGGVVPSQEIYREVWRLREQGKPIVASLGDVAASGGYYIAVAAETIFANPGTITGSIGVVLQLPNVEEFLQKVGVKLVIIKSGEYKDIGSPMRPLDKTEREILQGVVDDVYEQFIQAVAQGRNLPVDEVRKIADGRIFSGKRAYELGLVDQLGSLRDAILSTAKKVGIAGEPKIVQEEKNKGLFWYLLHDILPWNTRQMRYWRARWYQLLYSW